MFTPTHKAWLNSNFKTLISLGGTKQITPTYYVFFYLDFFNSDNFFGKRGLYFSNRMWIS